MAPDKKPVFEHERDRQLLREFVSIPSVSTDPDFQKSIEQACSWVGDRCREAGLETRVEVTDGHPAVVAHTPYQEGRPHLLIYGHYDVQPARFEDGWSAPPFQPVERDGYLYARGASDNKGQILAHLCALRYLYESQEEWPINITVLVEGEEEIGSPHLVEVLRRLKKQAPDFDLAVVSDTSTAIKGRPMIQYSLRGIVTGEVHVRTAAREVHSGIFGGTTENAARALVQLLAALHDDDYRVTVPGFYDEVAEPMGWEREALRRLPFDEAVYLNWIGASEPVGEGGYSTNERRWFRPTLEFHGLSGGYQGEGSKTIVPHRASAKLSARLVSNQDPQEIEARLEEWFASRSMPGVEVEYRRGHAGPPYLLGQDEKERDLLTKAAGILEQAFGVEPLLSRHGGAIPIVEPFSRILGVKTLLLGLGQPDDGVHSYDERFAWSQFHGGIEMSSLVLRKLLC